MNLVDLLKFILPVLLASYFAEKLSLKANAPFWLVFSVLFPILFLILMRIIYGLTNDGEK